MPGQRAATPAWDTLIKELVRRRSVVSEQAAPTKQQGQRIAELEARLSKGTHNSSKFRSFDPPFRRPPPRSPRKASGRKPRDQAGHKGVVRVLVGECERLLILPLQGARGRRRSETPVEPLPERRHVVELVIRRQATEYRMVAGVCACGRVQRSDFPENVNAAMRFDPGVSAFAVYTRQYLLRLFERVAVRTAAARDVRMPKLTRTATGCFRSEQGIAHFALIRSYLSPLRKASADIFRSLVPTFQGIPPLLRLQPE